MTSPRPLVEPSVRTDDLPSPEALRCDDTTVLPSDQFLDDVDPTRSSGPAQTHDPVITSDSPSLLHRLSTVLRRRRR